VGDDRVVRDVQSELEVETLSILHGEDTAIAYGTMKDHWILMDGLDMNLESRWSATLVREDGRWRIAAYHTSTNLFDNPLLEAAAGGVVKAGVAAGLLGLCAGAGIVWLRRRS
jgi:hypothetical protein